MNEYQKEQLQALDQVAAKIQSVDAIHCGRLRNEIDTYLSYREQLAGFQSKYFGDVCTGTCFLDRTSACCSKDGIITFWADVVVNLLDCTEGEVEDLRNAVRNPLFPDKCIYLGADGCRWKIHPLGCALFVCDRVQSNVLGMDSSLREQWDRIKSAGAAFRWPDRPVLFDHLEQVFIAAGCRSPLMYLHCSPGLLRVKQKAGLPVNRSIG